MFEIKRRRVLGGKLTYVFHCRTSAGTQFMFYLHHALYL